MFHPFILDLEGIQEELRQEWVCRMGIMVCQGLL